MRQIMTFCSDLAGQGRAAMTGPTFRQARILAAVGIISMSSQIFAQNQEKTVRRPAPEGRPAQAAPAAKGESTIPECMTKLNLSEEQLTKAKEIIGSYDQKLDAVWKQFGATYMATIRTECLLLAAVEDGLTEPQRNAVRAQRRQVAHSEKALAGTSTRTNQSSEKPADAVDQVVEGVGITLTAEQEAAAETVQQNYASHLRSLNRDIEGLHNRLVSLEADKLVELEKLLSSEQLAQLREGRQMTTGAPKITAVKKSATIAE